MSTPPLNTPALNARIVYLGKPNFAHHGPQAAIVHGPLAPDARDAVIAKVPPAARLQLKAANRWKVWAVYATDDWITVNGRRNTPPTAKEVAA
jgi:hypothetical protein